MLDLKAQLLGAGLVSEDQVKKVEAEQEKERERRKQHRQSFQPGGKGKKPKGKGKPRLRKDNTAELDAERWQRRVAALAAAGKSEQYDVIRNWVRRTRIDDPKAVLSDEAERFHFTKYDGQISWLSLEPALAEKLKKNEAAIIAFMGFNGLEHGMFPIDMAADVGKIRPEWVRHLEGWEPRLKEEDDRLAAELAAKEAALAELRGETLSSEIAKPEEEIAKPEEEIAKPEEEIAKSEEEIAKSEEEIAKPEEEKMSIDVKSARGESESVGDEKSMGESSSEKTNEKKEEILVNVERMAQES